VRLSSRSFAVLAVLPLFWLAPALTPAAVAKEISLEELRVIQGKMKSFDNLSVDFVQTSYTALRKKERTRLGKALFAKPGKFKWMLETPIQEYKIYDGKDFFDYSPESKSAVRYSPTGPKAYELHQIVDLVLNFESLLKRYDLVKAEQEGDLVKVELHPKTDSDVTSVELHMATKQNFISFLKMTLKNKNYLAHDFKNPNQKPIPAEAFQLPKTVNVTDSN
jgi:outer membrane lipoprotein-sorting protein